MNERLLNKLLDKIDDTERALSHQMEYFAKLAATGDALAHCGMRKEYPDIWDAWWRARGGHDRCTACNGHTSSEPTTDR